MPITARQVSKLAEKSLVDKSGVSPELMVLAIGSGSLMTAHVNDGGFWLVKEYFNLSVVQTLGTWTVLETAISGVALCLVLLASLIA